MSNGLPDPSGGADGPPRLDKMSSSATLEDPDQLLAWGLTPALGVKQDGGGLPFPPAYARGVCRVVIRVFISEFRVQLAYCAIMSFFFEREGMCVADRVNLRNTASTLR